MGDSFILAVLLGFAGYAATYPEKPPASRVETTHSESEQMVCGDGDE